MKHIGTLIAASVMAVLLTACGQQSPKQPEVKTETTTITQPEQQQPTVEHQTTVEENAAPKQE